MVPPGDTQEASQSNLHLEAIKMCPLWTDSMATPLVDIEGAVKDNKSSNHFRNKEKYQLITVYINFPQKKLHNFDRKTTFSRILFRGHWSLYFSTEKFP